jgi:hypothetical protein
VERFGGGICWREMVDALVEGYGGGIWWRRSWRNLVTGGGVGGAHGAYIITQRAKPLGHHVQKTSLLDAQNLGSMNPKQSLRSLGIWWRDLVEGNG